MMVSLFNILVLFKHALKEVSTERYVSLYVAIHLIKTYTSIFPSDRVKLEDDGTTFRWGLNHAKVLKEYVLN